MKILITAGGTSEAIDSVRRITNTGTGRLGALLAESFAADKRVENVCCLFTENAVLPTPPTGAEKISIKTITDVDSLEKTVKEYCVKYPFDVVIHSMAVSDYRVKTVSDPDTIIGYAEANSLPLKEAIENVPSIPAGSKIDSALDRLILVLDKTPKIISLFRPMLPDAVIIGFKLLSDVTEKELLDAAYLLLKKNDCDYVLANDLKNIDKDRHIGYLINREGNFDRYEGKPAIANAIMSVALT